MSKASRAETLGLLHEVIMDKTEDPADDIVAMGTALVEMGKVLKGVSSADAKAIIKSVMELHSIGVRDGS
jgi:hypothetical protein